MRTKRVGSFVYTKKKQRDCRERLVISGRQGAYLLGGTGAQALDQPAEHDSVLQRALQKRGRVRHALLRRLHNTKRYEPCNRLFCRIHGQTPQIPLSPGVSIKEKIIEGVVISRLLN